MLPGNELEEKGNMPQNVKYIRTNLNAHWFSCKWWQLLTGCVCVWGVPKTGKSTQPDLGWSHKKARVGMNWETDHSIYWYEKMEVHGNVQASNGN